MPYRKIVRDPEMERQIANDYASGKSIPQLADTFNVPRSRVRLIVVAAGVTRSHKEASKLVDWQKVRPSGYTRPPFTAEHCAKIAASKRGKRKPESIREKRGYLYYSGGPNSGKPVHRCVMEAFIGRPLRKDEDVHHKDGNPRNNDLSNLEIVTRSEHARIHAIERNPHRMRDAQGRYV